MKALIDFSVPPLTFILLAAVGLDLTSDDFGRLRRQRALVLVGLVGPLVLLPPIAIALAWIFRLPADIAEALLLVAACPMGAIANTYSYLARASTALSVTLTGLSCLFASLTVPAAGRALEAAVGRPLDIGLPPGNSFVQLLLMLALPIGLGMWVRRRWSERAARYRPTMQSLAFIGVGGVFVLLVLDDPHAFRLGLPTTVPLAAAFVACSAAAGWMAAATVSTDRNDRFTLAVAFGNRNLGVAMAIAVTLLGRVEFARFAYTYFVTEIPLMLAAIAIFRRRQRRAAVPTMAAGA